MFFMRLALDVIHADKQGTVLRILPGIRPWRLGPFVCVWYHRPQIAHWTRSISGSYASTPGSPISSYTHRVLHYLSDRLLDRFGQQGVLGSRVIGWHLVELNLFAAG